MIISTVQLESTQLEYCITGTDNPITILFVHGLGANLRQFEKQHAYFSKTYQVLSLSFCGHGNSIALRSSATADFGLSRFAKDIIQLLDFLKIKKVHYIGNSMGGNIGFELAQKSPDRLRSFTTFGTTGRLTKSKWLVGGIKLIYKILPLNVIAKLSSVAGQTQYAKTKIQDMLSCASKDTILAILPHLANFNYLDTIKTLKVNSMIMRGEKDHEINQVLKETISTFQKYQLSFQCKDFKEAGHFLNLDAPELFNEELMRFLVKVDRDDPTNEGKTITQ